MIKISKIFVFKALTLLRLLALYDLTSWLVFWLGSLLVKRSQMAIESSKMLFWGGRFSSRETSRAPMQLVMASWVTSWGWLGWREKLETAFDGERGGRKMMTHRR